MNTLKESTKDYVIRELKDLDISPKSIAWHKTLENAVEAADIMTKKELKAYIQEYIESLPNSWFY